MFSKQLIAQWTRMKMMETEDLTTDEFHIHPKMPLTIIFIIMVLCFHTVVSDCPYLCECKWKNGKETVVCLNANLSHVPLHLDSGTQVLDLTKNNIPVLMNEEFSTAGLLNLQRIFISRCHLKTLNRHVFKNLNNLVELDLSSNLLDAIPSHTFDSISELRELKLNDNPIQRIMNEAFISVSQLVRLEINDCKISDIEPEAFSGLEKSLEWLMLSNNKLAEIHPSSLTRLENLHGIELTGNSWNCTCSLRPLRNWMLKMNVPFGVPPICQNPKRVRGKSWEKLDLDEFACLPEIILAGASSQAVEGKNVTMTCQVAGVPQPIIKWSFRNRIIANLSGHSYLNEKKFYVVRLLNDSSDLTILSVDLQDAGIYVCSAENKAGRVESSVTLTVSKRHLDQKMTGKILTISVLIGIVFVMTSCSVVLCLCSRKKSVKWRTRENNRDENYEKIELNHKVADGTNGQVVIRSEVALINKKNGEYSVVPAGDTDQELDEDETSTLDIASKSSQWTKDLDNGQKWYSPDELPDPGNVNNPKHSISETRDDYLKSVASTSGISKQPQELSMTTSTNFANIPRESPDGHVIFGNAAKRPAVNIRSRIFPDILGNNSVNNYHFELEKSRRSNSEGGSIDDISELFCTLPRKTKRYRSSDSEAPLITDSRYISSGGDSFSSQESGFLKRYGDSQKYFVDNLNKNRVNRTSNSYLNLCRIDRPTTSQSLKTTPLLNVTGLENRPIRTEVFSPTSGTPNANSYDYHATQLERFLKEYKNLQKQLTKMKETCDNLRHDTDYMKSVPRTSSIGDVKNVKWSNPKDDKICSPNSNVSVENTLDFGNYQSDLTKYLLTKSSSPKPYSSGAMYDN
ncbi:hypothetical protein WA026_016170 [Henosepilachna vigintioctopunctata]|uniref:Ig-like domain-containing protein n=1 Tax=Henosepilachna vigintioctopunctata TaxID=420089 RepID=A0AAW1TMX2_9CUCU